MAFAEPVALTGDLVRLDPLAEDDVDDLAAAAADGGMRIERSSGRVPSSASSSRGA